MRLYTSISPRRGRRILADMIDGRHDLPALAAAHQVTPEALGDWIAQPQQQRTLANLCLLEDYQTQLYLSRCRSLAAARLTELTAPPVAEGGEEGKPDSKAADVRRRACMDLLQVELQRVAAAPPRPDDDEPADLPTPQQLYGQEAATGEEREPREPPVA